MDINTFYLLHHLPEVVDHSASVGPSFVLCKSDNFWNNNMCKLYDLAVLIKPP